MNPTARAGKVTLGQEFFGLAVSTIGPQALFTQAFLTGIRMANPPSTYPREWRQGAQGFGRTFGDRMAVQASRQTAKFLTGALMHEDLRYQPSTSKNPFARTAHAITFTFVDKTNSGHNTIALSNFVGAAAGGFVGNTYLPRGYNNLSHAGTRSAFEFGSLALANIMREYSPELGRFTRKIHLPRFPIPAWWVREK